MRRFQISLRSLFILVTLAALECAIGVQVVNRYDEYLCQERKRRQLEEKREWELLKASFAESGHW